MTEPRDRPPGDDELLELRSLVERAELGDLEWEPAPPELWNRIAAETGVRSEHTTVPSREDTATSITPRRRRWRAAVAGLAVAAATVVAVVLVNDDDEPDVRVLSAVDLEPVVGSAGGRAELVSIDDSIHLRLDTEDLDAPDGFFEVWLIDPSVTELVSLGPLRADGDYDVPAGVDAAAFPIVDISDEPVDGDPSHSGDSVLRGQLPL
jgi:anti-sigma-K factor RskA